MVIGGTFHVSTILWIRVVHIKMMVDDDSGDDGHDHVRKSLAENQVNIVMSLPLPHNLTISKFLILLPTNLIFKYNTISAKHYFTYRLHFIFLISFTVCGWKSI